MKDSNILNIVGRIKKRQRTKRNMARKLSPKELAQQQHQRSLCLVRQHVMKATQGPTYTGNPEPEYPGGAAA